MDRIDLNLPLERPLVFFDLETTGTDVAKDRIVEMAFVKVMPDGQWHVRPDKGNGQGRMLINPEMPIPAESAAVHGITDELVKDGPVTSLANRLYRWLDGWTGRVQFQPVRCALLAEEFLRCNIAFRGRPAPRRRPEHLS